MSNAAYEHIFDIIEILRSGGVMSVKEISEKLSALKEGAPRTRDTVYRILALGHDRGVFYRCDRSAGACRRVVPCWGYTHIPFSEPDQIVHSDPKGYGWTGGIRQRLAILEYDKILTLQERTREKSLRLTARKVGVSLSSVQRAVRFFRVVNAPEGSPRYFFYAKSAVLSEESRQGVLRRIAEGCSRKDLEEEFALSAEEYRRMVQFSMAWSTPDEDLDQGRALVKNIKEKMNTSNHWRRYKTCETSSKNPDPEAVTTTLPPPLPPPATSKGLSTGPANEGFPWWQQLQVAA